MSSIEQITEIGINEQDQLYLKPEKTHFDYIYRTGMGVQWDTDNKYLHSQPQQEWSYSKWYKRIKDAVMQEYAIDLVINDQTKWTNIPEQVKTEILQS